MNEQTIIEFISEELLNGDAVTADQDLLLSGLIDSLGVLKMVMFLENEFDVTIPAEDVTVPNMKSVETISAYIARIKQA